MSRVAENDAEGMDAENSTHGIPFEQTMEQQDAILGIGTSVSFADLYDAVRHAVPAVVPSATDSVVLLASCSSANNFTLGDCVTSTGTALASNSQLLTLAKGNQVSSDISSLVDTTELFSQAALSRKTSSRNGPHPQSTDSFKVLLWPVCDADYTLLALVLTKYSASHVLTKNEMLGFVLLGKQVIITVKRLRKTLVTYQPLKRSSCAAGGEGSSLASAAAATAAAAAAAVSANMGNRFMSFAYPNSPPKRMQMPPEDNHQPQSQSQSQPPNKNQLAAVSPIMRLCSELHDRDGTALQLKLVRYLKEHTQADVVLLLLIAQDCTEMFCQLVDEVVLEQEMILVVHENVFSKLMKTNQQLRLADLDKGEIECIETMLQENLNDFQGPISTFLSVPVARRWTNDKLAIVCLINKSQPLQADFTQADFDAVTECFLYTAPVLTSTIAFQIERRLKMQTETLLQVAKNIFRKLDNFSVLLKEIMAEAKSLTHAERCSVFLLEKERNQLVANVFDGLPTDSLMTEIRIPATQGIAGYVATTGQLLNIHDAYAHPLFYRGLDDETGFRTRNILCFPIKDDNGEIVGVAQLCNKHNAPHFSRFDEEIAKTFSVYCCISIVHCLMYRQLQEAQVRNQLANELMSYHMQVSDVQLQQLAVSEIKPPTHFLPDFDSLNCIPRDILEPESCDAVLTMFDQLGFIERWRMSRRTVAKFILMVKRGYRDPPYHNWYHALSVCHFIYAMIKNCSLTSLLREIELLGLFVASICHDVDHRGTNNSFQVESKSTLAALYSSEGSVLERHHFAQTLLILNGHGCNIFENLDSEQYSRILDLIRDIILATDLGRHFKIAKQQAEMIEKGYDSEDEHHRSLLLFMLMTSADLNDSAKRWRNARSSAHCICQEFFHQGDMERQIGRQPMEMMDRERANIPDLQIGFLQHVAYGVFKNLSVIFLPTKVLVENIDRNIEIWKRKRDKVQAGEVSGNSMEDMFTRVIVPEDAEN